MDRTKRKHRAGGGQSAARRLTRERDIERGAFSDGQGGLAERVVASGASALHAPVRLRQVVLHGAPPADLELPYHAAAQLLQEPRALGAAARRGPPRPDRLHR